MTIYAIVNNLIQGGLQRPIDETVWTVLSAASILQGGNPYFVPDFDTKFVAHPSLALRIGKLGKGIAPRFAHRYIESVAPAALITASNLIEKLRQAGLPWTKAISYDRSLAIGAFSKIDFEKIPECKISLEMSQPDESGTETHHAGNLLFTIGDTISRISRDNALKTGDIILTGISHTGIILEPGQRMQLRLNDENALKFNIR